MTSPIPPTTRPAQTPGYSPQPEVFHPGSHPGVSVPQRWSAAPQPPPATAARQLRRLWVLIAGTSVIVFSIIIAPLPGPGFTVLAPVGLAILAGEFMWAKRLINRVTNHTGPLERLADRTAMRMPIWIAPLVAVSYWVLVGGIALSGRVDPTWVFPPAGLLFAPVGFWCWRVYVLHRKRDPAAPRL